MTSSPQSRAPLPRSQQTAIAMIAVGIALAVVVGNLLDGFAGGLFQGAGIALIVIGTIVLSPFLRRHFRRTRGDDKPEDGVWLPSQDGDR